MDVLKQLIKQFMPFAQEQMGFNRPPKLFLRQDAENAANPLGKTGFYDPQAESITLYVSGRHPKDILRSLSHELMHHTQKCNGDFDNVESQGMGEQGYAQNNAHMRTMEIQAYQASIVFRDWEDSLKETIYYEHLQKGDKKMSTKDWKNGELTSLLSEAWGFRFNVERLTEGEEKSLEQRQAECARRQGYTWDAGARGNKCVPDKGDGDVKKEARGRPSTGGAHTGGAGVRPNPERAKKAIAGGKDQGRGLKEDSGEEQAWNDWKNEHADDDHIRELEHHLRALKEDRDYERKGAEYDHDKYEDEGYDRHDEAQLNEDSGEDEAWHEWKNEHADDDHIREMEHHLRALKEDRDYERHGAEYDHDHYEDEGDPGLDEGGTANRGENAEKGEERRMKSASAQREDLDARRLAKAILKQLKEKQTNG